MLARRVFSFQTVPCRRYTTAALAIRAVPILPNSTVETFRASAFKPATPAVLPLKSFAHLPAIHKWFETAPDGKLNALTLSYLSRFGETIVPLEFSDGKNFSRLDQPLSFFLSASTLATSTTKIYLAQASISDLPQELRDDVPTPEVVLKAGKGDVYDSSIWLGEAPTYTPLHRDPNPNLFVQLMGKKVVRLFPPEVGGEIFARVQERIGGGGNETMRGEEMMVGAEKEVLEAEVWGDLIGDGGKEVGEDAVPCWQAGVGSGDGLFIPKGWWHSVRSFGTGMTGSVNWWFR